MAGFILKDAGGRRRPLSSAAVFCFGLGVASAALAVGAGLGHRLGWWSFGAGFWILRWAFYAAAASLVLSVAGIGATLPRHGSRGLLRSLLGLAVSLPVILVPLGWLHVAGEFPSIHDISTDTEQPPVFVALLRERRGAPNAAEYGGPATAELQREAYPDLQPVLLPVDSGRAFRAALAAAHDLGWRVVAEEAEEGRIEATDTTFWFGFTDDVVVRVRRDEAGARVDVRSVSRVGHGDIGTNARRIRAFVRALQVRAGAADPAPSGIRPVSTGKFNT